MRAATAVAAVVRRKIGKKILNKINGKLDAALVGTGWRERNRKAGAKPVPALSPAPSPRCPRIRPRCSRASYARSCRRGQKLYVAANGVPMLRAPRNERAQNYNALLSELEYDTKAGKVVSIDECGEQVVEICAQSRPGLWRCHPSRPQESTG